MRIYISGPLQGSSDLSRARKFYDELAEMVRELGHDAYVPHHHTDPHATASMSPISVYDTDLNAIDECDAVIAHIGQPSTGVGAEIVLALTSGRSVLGVKRPGEPSSRFAEGLIKQVGGRVGTFDSKEELGRLVRDWLLVAEAVHPMTPPAIRPRAVSA